MMEQKAENTSFIVYLVGVAYFGAVSDALKQAVSGPFFLIIGFCYLILLSVLGDVVSKKFGARSWQQMSSTFRVVLLVICVVIALIAGIVTGKLLPNHNAL